MNKGKDKASWDVSCTGIFIKLCIEQIYKKERLGSLFTKDGWKNILSGFNEKIGRSYDKKQMKNRWDNLKKDWKVWDKLFSKETSIQYDPARHMVIADDEWWERKIQENAEYAKYRYRGLMFAKELDILFKDVLASGYTMFTPSTRQRLPVHDNEDDVYRPTMDLEEGSGDSEEDVIGPSTGGSVGVTGDMEEITLTTNTQTTTPRASDGSRKRKRVEGSERGKKTKTATSRVIADAVSKIAAATENRADALQKMSANDALNVTDIVAELLKIPEVVEDKDFCFRCSNMMMHQIGRDMFRGLQGDKTTLLTWLRHHAYNSPHLQLAPNQ